MSYFCITSLILKFLSFSIKHGEERRHVKVIGFDAFQKSFLKGESSVSGAL